MGNEDQLRQDVREIRGNVVEILQKVTAHDINLDLAKTDIQSLKCQMTRALIPINAITIFMKIAASLSVICGVFFAIAKCVVFFSH